MAVVKWDPFRDLLSIQEENYLRIERAYGAFQRSFTLPKRPEATPRVISVEAA